ncbi:MAG: prepilin-type N-terminal cleavage/methylation domain-containing protein [Candidatus Omnitrophica bacterium]|nr:prepilin-type N-terminal cleavage/methylation domain-containing protein [Candidatus Omnitrophota bacterium]
MKTFKTGGKMNKKGFTLIEVMIATGVMVFVLGALVYGLAQCSTLTETARYQDIALNAIQQKMEEIANNIATIDTNPPAATFAVVNAQGEALLTTPAGGALPGSVQITPVEAGQLYDVTVTVSWQQGNGRVLSRSLTTTLCKR